MKRNETRAETSLARLVQVRGRFHRSVHLPQDWRAARDPRGYFTPPALLGIAGQIMEELARPQGARAWTLTGPYGTGKSAFALFLADALAAAQPAHPQARALRRRHVRAAKPLRPLLVQAERAPLVPALLDALQAPGAAPPAVAKRARRSGETRAPEGAAVAGLLASAAAHSPGGLLLVVDELGKYLEYAAQEPGEDIFLLQQIAEAAARSKKPLLFLGVLHSGFGDYLADGAAPRRAEWQKVQGRFQDIPFSLPGEQLLELVGRALDTSFTGEAARAYARRFERIANTPALRAPFGRGGLREILRACLPLHPLAALVLWPLFRSKVAQNERSLFAFLTSHEPFGFQEFLARQEASARCAPLYGLAELYDYVSAALGMAALTGNDSRHWALISHALDRLPADAPPLQRALVKCIGLLSMYGGAAELQPGKALLRAACDQNGAAEFNAALAALQRASVVVFRRHNESFGLWEGSDIDLDAAFEKAREQRGGAPLHERLLRAGEPRPLVARAHYIQTGTLRFLDARFAAGDAKAAARVLGETTAADGSVLFMADAARSAKAVEKCARKISGDCGGEKPVLVAVPRDAARLGEALDELESWEWVHAKLPALEGDPVARQEIAARISAARARFERLAGRTFGLPGHVLDPKNSLWFCRGEKRRIENPRALQELISRLCGEAYCKAPPLHNELLNRENISTSASRARRNLLQRILQNETQERLDMEGFPPEYSMYLALLSEGGFHSKTRSGEFELRAPRPQSKWHPVWREMENFLREAQAQPRPLTDLFARLQAPPFGMRMGPLPVLFAVALRVLGDEVALYEDGLFVPDTGIETLERLTRVPQIFSLRSYRLNAKERKVVQALGAWARRSEQKGAPAAPTEGGLVAIVRELIRMNESLPAFAQHTRRLPKPTRAVRQLLQSAKDPRALLLEDLPKALDANLKSEGGPQKFARALRGSVRELTRAFPKLLDDVEEQVREAFGMEEQGEALREALRRRTLPLLPRTGASKLRLFLKEAARAETVNGRDWRDALGRAGADGKPPAYWRDEDLDNFAARLRVFAGDCDVLSALVAKAGDNAGATVARIGLLEPGAKEQRAVVALNGVQRTPVKGLARKLQRVTQSSRLDSRLQLMALALAAREMLQAEDSPDADAGAQ